MALLGTIPKLPTSARSGAPPDATLYDTRFRALLSDEDWGRLPLATWRRFSKRLGDGNTTLYVGEVVEVRFSRIGWWISQIARLIGGPLPTGAETPVPSIVTVTEDAATGGQVWTRIYTRRRGFPQVIHSSKRFAGPTGLEEYLGYGVGMALRMSVDGQVLVFRSAGYFLQLGGRKLPLPALLTPGVLTVTHTDLGRGEFQFTLEIIHPRFGLLIRQSAVFREATP
jgi:Domain of unknown function (DUF4166)